MMAGDSSNRSGRLSASRVLLLLAAVWLLAPLGSAGALEVPRLQGRVNDYAGMISTTARGQLEDTLRQLEESDSTQLVILTIPALEDEDLEGYSLRVAETWGIGQQEFDNGVLLLVSQAERKVRIEVGYGLEGRLTDLQAGRIIDYEIVPSFKAGNFDQGFLRGAEAITAAVRGEYEGRGPAPGAGGSAGGAGFVPFFVLAIFLSVLGSRKRIVSAVAGSVLLPLVALFALPFSWVLLLLLLPAGFVGGLILPGMFLFSGRRWSGGTRGGGFGGSSGGGFSGGGGSFGGGGASGRW